MKDMLDRLLRGTLLSFLLISCEFDSNSKDDEKVGSSGELTPEQYQDAKNNAG